MSCCQGADQPEHKFGKLVSFSNHWSNSPSVGNKLRRFLHPSIGIVWPPRTKKTAAHSASKYLCLQRVCQLADQSCLPSSFMVVGVVAWVRTICLAAGKVPGEKVESHWELKPVRCHYRYCPRPQETQLEATRTTVAQGDTGRHLRAWRRHTNKRAPSRELAARNLSKRPMISNIHTLKSVAHLW